MLTEVVRNGGAVLALATAVRKASHPGLVWPTSSRSDAAGSVVLHPHQGLMAGRGSQGDLLTGMGPES